MSSNTQTHSSDNTPAATGDNNTSPSQPPAGTDYPEQIHAGKVGYGPNFHTGPTLGDKIQGLKEELKGKVTHKPEVVQHGRDVLSGEERRRKLAGEDDTKSPFQKADDDKSANTATGAKSDAPTQPKEDRHQPSQTQHEHQLPSTTRTDATDPHSQTSQHDVDSAKSQNPFRNQPPNATDSPIGNPKESDKGQGLYQASQPAHESHSDHNGPSQLATEVGMAAHQGSSHGADLRDSGNKTQGAPGIEQGRREVASELQWPDSQGNVGKGQSGSLASNTPATQAHSQSQDVSERARQQPSQSPQTQADFESLIHQAPDQALRTPQSQSQAQPQTSDSPAPLTPFAQGQRTQTSDSQTAQHGHGSSDFNVARTGLGHDDLSGSQRSSIPQAGGYNSHAQSQSEGTGLAHDDGSASQRSSIPQVGGYNSHAQSHSEVDRFGQDQRQTSQSQQRPSGFESSIQQSQDALRMPKSQVSQSAMDVDSHPPFGKGLSTHESNTDSGAAGKFGSATDSAMMNPTSNQGYLRDTSGLEGRREGAEKSQSQFGQGHESKHTDSGASGKFASATESAMMNPSFNQGTGVKNIAGLEGSREGTAGSQPPFGQGHESRPTDSGASGKFASATDSAMMNPSVNQGTGAKNIAGLEGVREGSELGKTNLGTSNTSHDQSQSADDHIARERNPTITQSGFDSSSYPSSQNAPRTPQSQGQHQSALGTDSNTSLGQSHGQSQDFQTTGPRQGHSMQTSQDPHSIVGAGTTGASTTGASNTGANTTGASTTGASTTGGSSYTSGLVEKMMSYVPENLKGQSATTTGGTQAADPRDAKFKQALGEELEQRMPGDLNEDFAAKRVQPRQ